MSFAVHEVVGSGLAWTARREPTPPKLMQVEALAVLRRYELRGAVSPQRAAVALRRLLDLPVLLTGTASLLEEAWALRANITVPDACYVVLARHLGATLVTADTRLARSPKLGIEALVPPGE